MSQASARPPIRHNQPTRLVRADRARGRNVCALLLPLGAGTDESVGNFDQAIAPSPYFRRKPAIECAVVVALSVVLLPAMAAIGLAILLCDGWPVFYRQSRVGKGGRHFLIWKFRTMRRDAERRTGPVWSCKADARITPLGRWLRLSHVDELPQVLNVLSGDMSLIGPRPERPEFVIQLARELPEYAQRLQVRPGITGLAQLVLGYDRCVADVRRKIALDLQYIGTATLSRDAGLLFRTVPCVVSQLIRHCWECRRSQRIAALPQQLNRKAPQLQAVHGCPAEVHSTQGQATRVVPRRRPA